MASHDLLFQRNYRRHQDVAFVGQVSRPGSTIMVKGIAGVAAVNGVAPQPGYPVFYNRVSNRFEVPTTAAHLMNICGVIAFEQRAIKNSSGVIEYAAGDLLQVMYRGTIWVRSGAALEFGDLAAWDLADTDWVVGSLPTMSTLTEAAWNADARAEIATNVDAVIESFGYTRIVSLTPTAVAVGDLVEIYLSSARSV